MKGKLFFIVSVACCLALLVAACTKESQYIEAVKLSSDLYIEETDTLTPQFSVYRVDSFKTSGSSSALIGMVADPYFGAFAAKSYSSFNLSSTSYDNIGASTESFDSIALIMRVDRNYYGDTSALYSLHVNQLEEEIDGANTTYYNAHQLAASSPELGALSVVLRPNADDSVRIPLADDFGRNIFQLYKEKDNRITDNENFHQYFKGFQISPGAGNKGIYSFKATDSATYIRLYYHDDQGTPIPKYIDFLSQGGNYQFNNITYDPSGTELQELLPGGEIPSSQLNNQFYVNDLAGIGTKIIFPSAKELLNAENFVKLAGATLQLHPLDGSFRQYPLIPYMAMGVSTETSVTPSPLYTADNTALQNGSLSIDLLHGVNTSYSYDLSLLISAEIKSTIYTTNTISLLPYSSANARTFSLQRLVGADAANATNPSKLYCQLLFYKK